MLADRCSGLSAPFGQAGHPDRHGGYSRVRRRTAAVPGALYAELSVAPSGFHLKELRGFLQINFPSFSTFSVSIDGDLMTVAKGAHANRIPSIIPSGPLTDAPVNVGKTPPHPGEFIRDEVLDALRLSVTEAAEALGVRRATLSDLVNGHAALSPEMALRLEKAFAVNMDMLLRMQAWHDAVTMRSHAADIDVKPVAAVAMPKRTAGRARVTPVAVAKRAVSLGWPPKKKRDRGNKKPKAASRRGKAARG